MITVKKYTAEEAATWDAFVDASKNGTFMLKRGYMDYNADRFTDHSLLFYHDEELVALLPASQHGSELRSHGGLTYGGLITSTNIRVQQVLEIFSVLKEYMKEQGIASMLYKRVPEIYYRYPSDEDLYALFRIGATLAKRHISSSIYMQDKLKFTERRRRGVKQAAKNGIVVCQSDDYKSYMSILCDILRKYHNAKPVHTAAELELLASRFPDNIKLYAAFNDKKMLAGVVIYETDKVAHTQYIANSDVGRQCGALDAVMDYLINSQFTDKEYFDFGTSMNENGIDFNEGLITQKQEFGGRGIVYDMYELNV